MMAHPMSEQESGGLPAQTDQNTAKTLSPAARRALAEAEQRRAEYRAKEAGLPREIGGRGGHDPNRYGDWEVKGLTSDF